MTADRISAFTSDRARARFLTAYTRTFTRLWPADHAVHDVPTSYGVTRAYRTGQPDGVPMVLLPGAGGNSLMWHHHVTRLSQDRPVIAVDPCGEPGASTQNRAFGGGADLSHWLGETLAGLGVPRAHLVGCSYGGWIALRHAIHAPGQVATVSLLDPAGFGRVTARFLAWVIVSGLAGLAPRPLRRHAAGWLHNTTLLDDDLMRLVIATAGFRRRLPTPPPVTDDVLRTVTVPALVLLGERSQLYDAGQVAARVRRLLPDAQVEVVADAAHDLPMYLPASISQRILDFVNGSSSADDQVVGIDDP
ncbi:alpha/beta fold hydrolase [Micromonospora sp. NBC_01813]|uniref:alpha/beta fold hydrolase n=1 Tax=Micromonospora sp. NBC_01813 TaxID=2975988 RepID=UPI002DD860B8|nr:alpha/beta fold hydrolase [Micromonospora sp. NBC_01813]WSA06180.1 alpha/beta fold hydrolase [Micromonospora sp. NBC_01813]